MKTVNTSINIIKREGSCFLLMNIIIINNHFFCAHHCKKNARAFFQYFLVSYTVVFALCTVLLF